MTELLVSPDPLVDIGVNLSNTAFSDQLPNILQRAQQANVRQLVITGTSVRESEQAVAICGELANDFPDMLYSTCGVHPHDAKSFTANTIPDLKTIARAPQVVAIGETGLDFNRNYSSPSDQESAFEAQLELAAELGLPLFMHERDAHQRQFEILRQFRDHICDGVIHCFTGDRTALFNYLDLDLHIGITGWVCDERRGLPLQSLVASIPDQRLLLETDAPYLLPRNMDQKPKARRNEPAFLPWVLQMVALCKGQSEEQVARQTSHNARRFFRLPQK
ncbi:MAG: hydrolase TatD [Gammaproteobacteria bacterium]|nr:MAG: hydrolase TatD [Gammaproteobacteria bacterium]